MNTSPAAHPSFGVLDLPPALGYGLPPNLVAPIGMPQPCSGSTVVCTPDYFGSANFGSDPGGMAGRFMGKFWFEDGREFVPDEEFYSPQDPEEPRVPNTFELVKRFLKQVRESKGYDVDCTILLGCLTLHSCHWIWKRPRIYYNHNVLGSAAFALGKINEWTGRDYELVEIVKAVDTRTTLMYLTFTARDCNVCNVPVETFQALTEVPYGPYGPNKTITKLFEWRRKPDICQTQ